MSKEYISDIQEIIEQIVQFTRDRDWDQFHNGKDLALALSIEAAELKDIILSKLAQNAEKYPVDKSKGNAKKYTEL